MKKLVGLVISLLLLCLLCNALSDSLNDETRKIDISIFDSIDSKNPRTEYQIRYRKNSNLSGDDGGLCNVSAITTLLNRRLVADYASGSFTVTNVLSSLGCKNIKTDNEIYCGKNFEKKGTKWCQYYYFSRDSAGNGAGQTAKWNVDGQSYSNGSKTYSVKRISGGNIKKATTQSNFYAYIANLLHEHPEGIAIRNTKANHVAVIYRYSYSNGTYKLYVKDPMYNYSGPLEKSYIYDKSGKNLYNNIDFIVYINGKSQMAANAPAPVTPVYGTLEFQNVTCPVNYKIGSSNGYILTGGTLVSNEELKSITSTIKKTDGSIISGPRTVNLSGKSFSIKSLDTMKSGDNNGVKFSWIKEAGNYVWVLTATDASKSLTLEMPFTASSNATSSHDVSISYVPVTGVTLDKNEITLTPGNTEALIATVLPDNATNKNVTWSSNNQSAATVDGNGLVRAVAPGTATITVTTVNGGKMATCVATVLDNSGIEINGINFPDMHFREYVRQFDTDGNGYLNENEIKAVSTISIDSHGINSLGGIEYFTELIELYCPYNQLTSLDVSKNTKLKYLNCDGNQITSLITGNNTFLQSICCGQNKLKSLNLSENTGLKELYCYDNQLTSLDIRDNTGLEWLSCGYNQLTSLVVSQNTYLTTLWCANNQLAILDVSKNTELKYLACYKNQLTALDISKNTKLMQLDCKDNRLTTLDISNCPVLVSLVEKTEFNGTGWQDGEYYWLYAGLDAHNIITDTETSNDIVSVTGVTLNKTSLTLKEKETETLSATVIPFNAYNQKITWSSSDSNVVKVDANGKVTAVKAGKTTITVMTEDGGKTATCTVTVVAAPVAVTSVKLNKTSVQITEGETLTLAAMIAPTNAANQKVTWNSSDRKVAKVDAKGKVTAVSYGEATITVTTEDGKKTAICTVTVEPKDKIKAYVTRCYSIILGREPDKSGLDMWDNELRSGLKAAAEIIEKFVNSPEFVNKNYSKGDAVEILYKTMLDRGSDPKGKKNWVDKLEAGRSFAAVINGFCESPEFTKICRTYGIKAGSVIDPDNDTRTPDEKIRAFVQRCYRMILNRDPDEGGMNTWFNELKSGRKAASEIIDKFVNSPEYIEKNHTESESVEILYNAMLGRGSDPAGKANWVTKLENGQPFAVVINGFCVSKEFTGICASYGIEPGTVKVQALSGMAEEEALSMLAYKAKKPITKKSETNPTRVEIINPSDTIDMNIGTAVQAVYINEEKAKEFISRCYQCILGREASAAELDNWIGQMTNGTKTPDQIARGFLFSNEFKGKNISNEDLVKILYKVYMNRDADPEGLKTWTEKLDGGTELKALLDAFAKTSEFKKVVNEMSK